MRLTAHFPKVKGCAPPKENFPIFYCRVKGFLAEFCQQIQIRIVVCLLIKNALVEMRQAMEIGHSTAGTVVVVANSENDLVSWCGLAHYIKSGHFGPPVYNPANLSSSIAIASSFQRLGARSLGRIRYYLHQAAGFFGCNTAHRAVVRIIRGGTRAGGPAFRIAVHFLLLDP